MTTFDELQRSSWQVAEDHGFHKARLEMDPWLAGMWSATMLMVTELAEAAEIIRECKTPADLAEIWYEYDLFGGAPAGIFRSNKPWAIVYHGEPNNVEFAWAVPATRTSVRFVAHGKPAGFAVELIDCVIRIADTLEELNQNGMPGAISGDEILAMKEAFNRTRKFMHGKQA